MSFKYATDETASSSRHESNTGASSGDIVDAWFDNGSVVGASRNGFLLSVLINFRNRTVDDDRDSNGTFTDS